MIIIIAQNYMRIPKSIRVSVKYLTLIGKNKLDLESFC